MKCSAPMDVQIRASTLEWWVATVAPAFIVLRIDWQSVIIFDGKGKFWSTTITAHTSTAAAVRICDGGDP